MAAFARLRKRPSIFKSRPIVYASREQEWEPKTMSDLFDNPAPVGDPVKDIIPDHSSVHNLVNGVRIKSGQLVATLHDAGLVVPDIWGSALSILSLHMEEGTPWSSKSDMLHTKLLAVCYHANRLVAHPDSVYLFSNGFLTRIQEIPENHLRYIEAAIYHAAKIFHLFSVECVPKRWGDVTDALKVHWTRLVNEMGAVTSESLRRPKNDFAAWAHDAMKAVLSF